MIDIPTHCPTCAMAPSHGRPPDPTNPDKIISEHLLAVVLHLQSALLATTSSTSIGTKIPPSSPPRAGTIIYLDKALFSLPSCGAATRTAVLCMRPPPLRLGGSLQALTMASSSRRAVSTQIRTRTCTATPGPSAPRPMNSSSRRVARTQIRTRTCTATT